MNTQQPTTRWAWFKERLRDMARLPLIVLLGFTSSMAAWLGMWLVWRASQFLFERYLAKSWIE